MELLSPIHCFYLLTNLALSSRRVKENLYCSRCRKEQVGDWYFAIGKCAKVKKLRSIGGFKNVVH